MDLRSFLYTVTAALTLAAVAGCDGGGGSGTANTGGAGGGGGGTTTDAGGSAGSGGGGGSSQAMPDLGTQIDRMGRPAINTAANQTFNDNPEQADQGKDAYNASPQASWGDFAGEIAANLAILDSLDTVCGNQLLADMTKNDATRYATLAGALADDRIYVNADGPTCTTYLAVEANATNLLANTDCGGRRLSYDVIDVSYTVLAAGTLDMSIKDDVPISDAAKGETFPHLQPPH